ncbi:MAG: hypothetical protein OJF52_001826 [Nitrospira sp.]|jgi:hypothetical protein|nr:MAG: hypothetical protein OJF52_001826 [Nitrospira sp.]
MHCEPILPNGVDVNADGAQRTVDVGARHSWLNSRSSVRVAKTLDEDAIERHKREFIEPAAMLYAVQKVYGDQTKAKAMAAYGRLLDAHMLVTGCRQKINLFTAHR